MVPEFSRGYGIDVSPTMWKKGYWCAYKPILAMLPCVVVLNIHISWKTLLLLLFHFSILLSHLMNLLSFSFYLLYYLSQPSIFSLLSFQPSTSQPPQRTNWHTHSLTHFDGLQWLHTTQKAPKQQPPRERNISPMWAISHFFILKIQQFVSECMWFWTTIDHCYFNAYIVSHTMSLICIYIYVVKTS